MQTNSRETIMRFEETLGEAMPCADLIMKNMGGRLELKKYSRLNESIIRNHLRKQLDEIKKYGIHASEKIISGLLRKRANGQTEIELDLEKKLSECLVWVSMNLDVDNLVGFCVPLIYGGIVTSKNYAGESVICLDFGEKTGSEDGSDWAAKIQSCREEVLASTRGGISVICIRGEIDQVFSREMCRTYSEHPDRSFIIIHKVPAISVSGEASYKREILNRISPLKNLFIAAECDEEKIDNGARCVRSLRNYKKLCGLRMVGKGNCNDHIDGVSPVTFDRNVSFCDFIGVDAEELRVLCYRSLEGILSQNKRNSPDIFAVLGNVVPQKIKNDILSIDNEVVLPDIYNILSLIQFISCRGRLMGVRIINI